MDAETKALILKGRHPAQIHLPREYSVAWRVRDIPRSIRHLQKEWEERFDRYEAGELDALDRKPPKLEAEEAPRPTLRRINRRLPLKNRTAIRRGYFEHPALRNEFEVTCVLDYHTFAFDRTEFYPCNNPTCQLHMRRLQELNSRLKEDLERPRVKVAEASMSLINYCNQTRDYMVPSVWGQVDRKEDPYNPQSGGSEGCCSVM
ncbi:hypothetical protein G647_02560 [Cladophialophora carrionii CBS 160.54]|uniref:Guanine nucleotide-binding protein subunit gamma n=1 Tax=Cladophialophora carrionii CBS 160.54 TaxID=1279043 RepID=V9DGH1_9EURO|nr:uncharacterized protein G647_02560 [Cladophialophora carrionii CBS 160.54]ETI25786.1 hypothetical protein G647_02560 [Cladophialophora carrionii CBS 160.54]